MFKCNICTINLKNIRTYNIHQYLHRNKKNVSFQCLTNACRLTFQTYRAFRQHVFRNHSSNKRLSNQISDISAVSVKCEICDFTGKNTKSITKHYYNHIISGIAVKCPFFKICKSETQFKKKNTLAQHLTRFHKSQTDIFKNTNDSTYTINDELNEYLQEIPCSQETDENEISDETLNSLSMKL